MLTKVLASKENILMAALVVACLVLTALNLFPRLQIGQTEITRTQPTITVSVAGEVKQPGTYSLPWGATTEDAIRSAGGFAATAEVALVNLAEPLDTGEQVFVPAGMVATTQTERVSVNSANAALLDTLPSVGPATAQRIIEGRPYSTLEDLLDVKGIGEKTLEKLRPFITL
ncbi:MAG: helix-hairpin-helix domain-containing protein [Trueperaceae bacterium]